MAAPPPPCTARSSPACLGRAGLGGTAWVTSTRVCPGDFLCQDSYEQWVQLMIIYKVNTCILTLNPLFPLLLWDTGLCWHPSRVAGFCARRGQLSLLLSCPSLQKVLSLPGSTGEWKKCTRGWLGSACFPVQRTSPCASMNKRENYHSILQVSMEVKHV